VSATRDLLERFEAVNMKFAEVSTDEEMNAPGGAGEAPGPDRGRRCLGAGPEAGGGHGRAPPPPPDADVTKLSGGEQRRVALCRVLLEEPDLLLLDEPTNHLDAESVAWLEQHLARFKGTIVAITHDRYFLDNVAQWILELDRGEGYPTRATTPPGSSRSRSGCARKRSRSRPDRRPSSGSWSGSG
jgi:energy-dependent translational throttle protein EttA